jgi:hypothetical protein
VSGIVVIRALLVAHAPLTALVPESRIVADHLPQDTDLPAISVLSISSVDRKVLRPRAKRRVTDRVEVSVLARDASERLSLVRLVRSAAADRVADFDELSEVSVTTDGQGPDVTTETGIRTRSQDFLVSYNEATQPSGEIA